MQHGSSGTTEPRNDVSPPPALTGDDPDTSPATPTRQEARDEDSGLHDIRNLAQSTKQRLSSRRITAPPVADDVLASSSGSFKNIALPQPAKMVSLPALDELPSKAEVVAADKAAKKAAKDAAKEAKKTETAAPAVAAAAVATPAVAEPQPAVETPAVSRQAFALPSQQRKSNKSKTGLFAVIGIGLAAAAGAVIYMQTSKSADHAAAPAADQTVAKAEPAIAPPAAGSATITATEIPVAPPPAEPAVAAPEETAAAGAAQIAADEAKDDAEEKADTKAHRKAKGTKKVEKEEPKVEQKKAPDKTEKADKNVKTDGKGSGEEEPSFDALLKEAGVSEKKEAKPKLAKKKLTGSDFKAAMDGVEGKAKACYKGTVGTVMVHMTIEPDGSIKKLTVGGAFAGKPEAACVQAAMKTATFPPWDGAPQSFSYAVMLSD
jgi:hypothetical protein